MACVFCGGGQPDEDAHHTCWSEFDHRLRGGDCTACGDLEAAKGDIWCDACLAAGTPPYLGYSGSGPER